MASFFSVTPTPRCRLRELPALLPVKLQHAGAPVGIITLKNRTLSPTARLVIETARDVAKPLARRKW